MKVPKTPSVEDPEMASLPLYCPPNKRDAISDDCLDVSRLLAATFLPPDSKIQKIWIQTRLTKLECSSEKITKSI